MSTSRKSVVVILSVLAIMGGWWGFSLVDRMGKVNDAYAGAYAIALVAASLFVSSCVCTAAVLASRPDRQA